MNTPEAFRKFVYTAGAALVLLTPGCSPEQPKPTVRPTIAKEALPKQDQTQEVLAKIHQEVSRLVQTYPEDSLVRRVYLGNLNNISPIFTDTLPIGIADPKVAYARTYFGQPEYTSNNRFRCILNSNQRQADYATLERVPVAIYFSPTWLNSKNDDVKKLALEKEAYTVALWEPFGEIAIAPYRSQSRIVKIDPSVTDAEIVRTFTRQILIENADVLKLYDYAGYLPILSQIEVLLATQDPTIKTELELSNLSAIYNLAKQKGVKFEGLEFGSKEFLQTAFDPNGPWAKMILSPSVAGPVPIN